MQWAPLSGSEYDFDYKIWRHELCHAFSTCIIVKWINVGPVFVFSQYHKDGIDHSLFKQVADITQNGKYPFIILADFNATPQEVGSLHYLHTLQASVVTTGEPTCFQGEEASTIDFCVMSDKLLPCIQSLRVIPEVPWSPHALLELTLNKSFEVACVDKQEVVCDLVKVPELIEGLDEDELMYEWGEAEVEAQSDVESHEAYFEAHLEDNQETALALFRWCRTLEYWYIRLWNKKFPEEPILDCSKFLGRGLPPSFKQVPLKKEGNKDVFGKIDFGSHETVSCRHLLLLQRIVQNVLKPSPKPFWVTRLKIMVSDFHAKVAPYLGRVVGFRATTNLFIDLCQLELALVGGDVFPPNLSQRLLALIRKSTRLSKETDHQAWVDSVKRMLDKNIKGAHKFCNSHNLSLLLCMSRRPRRSYP